MLKCNRRHLPHLTVTIIKILETKMNNISNTSCQPLYTCDYVESIKKGAKSCTHHPCTCLASSLQLSSAHLQCHYNATLTLRCRSTSTLWGLSSKIYCCNVSIVLLSNTSTLSTGNCFKSNLIICILFDMSF